MTHVKTVSRFVAGLMASRIGRSSAGAILLLFLVAGTAMLAPADADAGPVSPLYLTHQDHIDVVQGGGVVNSFPSTYGISGFSVCCDLAIAVNATVRTLGYDAGFGGGQEYTLAGVPTGTTYGGFTSGGGGAYDGTTDGLHNYTVGYFASGVVQYDSAWANPVVLGFATDGQMGITYDPTDNTLWTSCYGCGAGVQHWTMAGALLGGFATPGGVSGADHRLALALDHADDTLWMFNQVSGLMEHWTKGGVQLGDGFSVAAADVYGAETPLAGIPVPEPGTVLLLGSALAGFLLHRRWART